MRARVLGAPRSSVLASFTTAMAPLDAELTETDLAAMVSAVLTVARHRCLVVLLTELNPAVIEEGLLPRLGPLVSRDMVMIAAVADPRIAEMAAARGDAASALRRGRGGRRAGRSGAGSRPCCGARASAWWTPRRTGCRPRWPTPTSTSRPAAASED